MTREQEKREICMEWAVRLEVARLHKDGEATYVSTPDDLAKHAKVFEAYLDADENG